MKAETRLPPRCHSTADEWARMKQAAHAARIRHGVCLVPCDCMTDGECIERIWWPCDEPERPLDVHAVGGDCPRCMMIYAGRAASGHPVVFG